MIVLVAWVVEPGYVHGLVIVRGEEVELLGG